ncbi:VENN motif pre-toxin domain-containing protein [Burkholderia ubonensis]|uniref:VENN motif pre-toxin domain-containing protein n=1 Tax=Burkholderia ubonensis TaxID=101571 RepID=UPI0018DF673E
MAPLLVDQAGRSNNLTASQRAAIVGVSTLLGGLAAGLAGQNAMAGATAAENESLNNATSTKNPKFAAKMLRYDYEHVRGYATCTQASKRSRAGRQPHFRQQRGR